MSVAGELVTYTLDYAGGGRVLLEEGGAFSGTKHYLYGRECIAELVNADEPESEEWRYYHPDGNHLVRQTTNMQATITFAWTYSPEGAVLLGEEGPVTNLGCGAIYDWSTGLIFKQSRYFDPNAGIWITLSGVVVWNGWQTSVNNRNRKRQRRKRLLLLLLLFLVIITLVGCGGNIPAGTPIPDPTETCTPTNTPIPSLPSSTPTNTPTKTPTSPPTNTPSPTLPSNLEWLPGAFRNETWWVIHYYIPIESDPYYASEREIEARGLPSDRRYKEQFIHDVYQQGTGLTKDGYYISVDFAKSQSGLGYLKLGHGKPNAVQWQTVASLDSRLPRGKAEIVIGHYQHLGVFRVEDEGKELMDSQVDVFVGEMLKAEVDSLGATYSKVWILR